MGRKVFFFFSFILLTAASFYCLNFVCANALFPDYVISNSNIINSVPNTPLQSDASFITEPNFTENAPSSEPSKTSSALPTTANGKALGKIITRTITASGANLKYQKVYLKNQTGLSINLKAELLTPPKLKIETTKNPQVLIVHTHTTECYMNDERNYYTETDKTRTTNEAENVVAVGKVLKEGLEKRGIITVHATEKHDYPEYSGSYSRAEATIKKYLKKYPTIKVVIDLHRDSVTDNNKTKSALVSNINGKKAAQLMLVSGCESGSVTGFKNWKENFRLAIRLQQTMEVMYPTLARPILFTSRKYNQHLTTGSLLIECGTEANTLNEAKYSAELLANCLASTLNMLKTD